MRSNGAVLKWRNLNYREKLTLVQCPKRQLPPAPGGDEVGGRGDTGSCECGSEEIGVDGIAEDNRKWGKRRPYLGRQSSGVPDLKGRQEHSQHSKGSWGVKCVCAYVHICVSVMQEFVKDMLWRIKCSVCMYVCTIPLNFQMSKKNLLWRHLLILGSDPMHKQVRTQTFAHSYALGHIEYSISVSMSLWPWGQSHLGWLHMVCRTYQMSATKSYIPTQTNTHLRWLPCALFPPEKKSRKHERRM